MDVIRTNLYSVIEILCNFVTTLNWWSDPDKVPLPPSPLGSFIQVSLSKVACSENPLRHRNDSNQNNSCLF